MLAPGWKPKRPRLFADIDQPGYFGTRVCPGGLSAQQQACTARAEPGRAGIATAKSAPSSTKVID
jgi:hypothetical protein